MAMRAIDGFNVESTTIQPNLDLLHFYPALRVTKPGTAFDETTAKTPQDFERVSQAHARHEADQWLRSVDFIGDNGELPRE